jgi:hypothetical protein
VHEKFTEDESRIQSSVHHCSVHLVLGYDVADGHILMNRFNGPPSTADQRSLILLPHLLSKVSSDASGSAFISLLRIVHKYPLRAGYYSDSDELPPLYQQVVAAAEKYLGPYSRVSVRFYTM